MIVITWNGHTRVYEGWRAWVLIGAAFLLSWALLAFLAAILVGVALTVGVILLLILPAALITVALGTWTRR